MQTHQDWQYVQNQFQNALGRNYKATNIVAKDHVSTLANFKADGDILVLYNRTLPVYNGFQLAYTNWKKRVAFYKGATSAVDRLLEQFRTKLLPRWDVLIQVFYMPDTAEYLTLVPSGRTGMYLGGKDSQIQAVRTLSESLLEYPDLASLQEEVANFYANIEKARDIQQQREQAVQGAADDLRKVQADVCLMMYRNLGRLMDKYAQEPQSILNFYQLDLVRNVGAGSKAEEEEMMEIEPDMGSEG
ncbi:MAG: hypothetical protein JNM36_13875 [Chitinophagales bacterium]|nr:hypothetical protein [Chitinophagales bacterium]